MNYFIDCEATQFTNDIISFGCISEYGDEFYELIHTDREITPFITELTGITEEMNANAQSLDEVFNYFYDWLIATNDDTTCHFFCYGKSDFIFISKAAKKATLLNSSMVLSLIIFNLVNYAPHIKKHFGFQQDVSLIKVVNYYSKQEVIQTHNALEDAKFLKLIFDKVNEKKIISEIPIKSNSSSTQHLGVNPRERKIIIKNTECIYVYDENTKQLKYSFKNFKEACDWLCETIRSTMPTYKRDNKALSKKIIWADINKLPYQGMTWVIQQKGN